MKAKHQRLVLVLLAVAAMVGAVLLAMSALRDQAAYFYTPSDAARAHVEPGRAVRLGGMVADKSVVHDPDGITQDKIDWVKAHKTKRRGRISEYAAEFKGATFHAGKTPWGVECDVALPCATQNELLGDDARMLIKNGCMAVSEGANMPTNLEGVDVFKDARILFAPGKAANAGGVAVSGLEMSQNSARMSWKQDELQQLLKDIMDGIHERCLRYGQVSDDYTDYVKGANIAGFKKVADAMLAFGVV